jgi:hypothetical protein
LTKKKYGVRINTTSSYLYNRREYLKFTLYNSHKTKGGDYMVKKAFIATGAFAISAMIAATMTFAQTATPTTTTTPTTAVTTTVTPTTAPTTTSASVPNGAPDTGRAE